MTIEHWISILGYIVGGIVFVTINAYKLGQLEARLVTKEELKEKVEDRNNKLETVYRRFDDFKQFSNDTYVRKDMCGQMHIVQKEDIKRIDEEYRIFRNDIRVQIQGIMLKFELMNEKIDELKDMIIKLEVGK